MKYQLRDYQQSASDSAVQFFNSKNDRNGLLVLPTGCHAKGTKILIWNDEPKKVEDIIVGDMLVGADGKPRKVLSLHHGEDNMYRIVPNKGEPFIVNGGHILSLHKTNEGKAFHNSQIRIDEISVADYMSQSKTYKHLHKLRKVEFVDFDRKESLPIHPYLLGLIIGDGCTSHGSVSITSMRKEVEEYLFRYAERNDMRVSVHLKNNGSNKAKTYYMCGLTKKRNSNKLMSALRDLGIEKCVAGTKYVPTIYKVASRFNRAFLLAGLLDTDSHYNPSRCAFEYCTKSQRLADDVVFLCRSLGLYAKIGQTKYVKGTAYYRICITGDLHKIPTKVWIRKGDKRTQKKSIYVTGFTVEPIGRGEYYGFTIDGDHLYCDGQFFIHHNSGKSLVIADTANRLDGNLLVLQPSKEILIQNYDKLRSYGVDDCSIYSASCGSKEISRITFATIGSIMGHIDDFDHFRYIMVDEAHVVNATAGQYKTFFDKVKRKILGLTATPYRLTAALQYVDKEGKARYRPKDEKGSEEFDAKILTGELTAENRCMLKFLTRTRPRVFHDVIYSVDISTLLARGYLAKLRYFDLSRIDQSGLKRNSTGMDYDETDLREQYERTNLNTQLINIVQRLQKPKNGIPRKGILVFTRFIEEAEILCDYIDGCEVVTGSTPKKERERILRQFKDGEIKVVANVGVLTTGFDYPELDTIVMARPTMSLALWYQIVGRGIRPHPDKEETWVVDLGGNYKRFGSVENLHLYAERPGEYVINGYTDGAFKPLTNIYF